MGLFDNTRADTLSNQELAGLKVAEVGLEVKAKKAECNSYATNPTAAVLMSLEKGKGKICRWALSGGLGEVAVHTQRLGGDRCKMVILDLSDLSKFKFLGDEDPRNGGEQV